MTTQITQWWRGRWIFNYYITQYYTIGIWANLRGIGTLHKLF